MTESNDKQEPPAISPLFLTVKEWHRLVNMLNDHIVCLQKLDESFGLPWGIADMKTRHPELMQLMDKLLYEWKRPEEQEHEQKGEHWHAYFTVHGDPLVVTDPSRPAFTEVCKVSKSPDDYGLARTLLIAAAPELLEALQGLAKAYSLLPGAVTIDGSWHSHAMAAIKKATG